MVPSETHECREKLALVWAERRQRLLALRVQYEVTEENGCKLFQLRRIEPLD